MAQQSGERIWGTYTTDGGDDYNVACKKAFVTQAGADVKLGYAAGSASQLGIPNEVKMRKVKCVDAAGHARWFPAYTTAASIWTTPGITLQANYFGVDTEFTSTKYKRSESIGRSINKAS